MATMTQLSKSYASGITCHAWNADGTKLAVCPNNNELHIYGKAANGQWTLEAQLGEHDMLISSVDWCHSTNSIVTCSHDRNAFVWSLETQASGLAIWKPSLVILRIDRSALDVKWSPNGMKFAAASGAKCVSVCSFEASENWWVSKSIKKHKSTVLCLAWHPNSQFLATGSSDFKCRVFSAYISDESGQPDPPTQEQLLGRGLPFGEPYYEFPSAGASPGWINCLAWSPGGTTLAFTGHDSSVHVVSFTGTEPVEMSIKLSHLPLCSIAFVSDKAFIAGGHNFSPLAFTNDGGNWREAGFLEQKETAAKKADSNAPLSAAAQARAKFAAMNMKGSSSSSSDATSKTEDQSWRQHQSPINCMRVYGAPLDSQTFPMITTTAMDGRLVTWDLAKCAVPAPELGL